MAVCPGLLGGSLAAEEAAFGHLGGEQSLALEVIAFLQGEMGVASATEKGLTEIQSPSSVGLARLVWRRGQGPRFLAHGTERWRHGSPPWSASETITHAPYRNRKFM